MSLDDWLKANGFEPGPHGVYEFDREDIGELWNAGRFDSMECSAIFFLESMVDIGASDLALGAAAREAVKQFRLDVREEMLSREKL